MRRWKAPADDRTPRLDPGYVDWFDLDTRVYRDYAFLCEGERFADQPVGPFCSGFLVAPDLVLTAGHCVASEAACEMIRFVFGFSVKKEGEYPRGAPGDQVYACRSVVARGYVEGPVTGGGFGGGTYSPTRRKIEPYPDPTPPQPASLPDWALIRLDRSVPDHAPLRINRTGYIEPGAPILIIGHPAGLPTKIAGNAVARDVQDLNRFTTTLDSFHGNSGSPVLNARTLEVEGILVDGESDYDYPYGEDRCARVKTCALNGCSGEGATKIAAVAPYIPDPDDPIFQRGRPR